MFYPQNFNIIWLSFYQLSLGERTALVSSS